MEKYKSKYPSYGKDVSVKYIKCNNINVNLNGIEIDINSLPGLLGSEVAAEAAETGAISFGDSGGNNGSSGHDNKGLVFVCINNNNNAGQVGDETSACEDCFRDNLGDDFGLLETALAEGIEVNVAGQDVVVNSLQDICLFLEGLDGDQIVVAVGQILEEAGIIEPTDPIPEALLACIEVALDIDLPIPTV